MSWPDNADQLGPTELRIKPTEAASEADTMGGISSTVLRHIDFRDARTEWVSELAIQSGALSPEFTEWLRESREFREKNLRRLLDSSGVSETYLAYLAEAYMVIVQSGERAVAHRLSQMTGRTPETMKQHIHKARKSGMLSAAPGKAGGYATERAGELILEYASTEDS